MKETVTAVVSVELPAEVVDALVEQLVPRVQAALQVERSHAHPVSPYLTVPEAATYLRCKRQRIDDLLSARALSRIKEGGRTLVSRAEIEAYLRVEPARLDASALPPLLKSGL